VYTMPDKVNPFQATCYHKCANTRDKLTLGA